MMPPNAVTEILWTASNYLPNYKMSYLKRALYWQLQPWEPQASHTAVPFIKVDDLRQIKMDDKTFHVTLLLLLSILPQTSA